MLIPSTIKGVWIVPSSLSRRVNANSQLGNDAVAEADQAYQEG